MTQARWFPALLAAALTLGACNSDTTAGPGPCSKSSNCASSQYCSAGVCYPKVSAGACGDTAEHLGTDVCTSGLCLGGGCCNAACASSESACAAARCDSNDGTCQYPGTATACGAPEGCVGGMHTATSSCDGKGDCTLAQAQPCDSGVCADSMRCVVSCQDNAGCAPTEYCSSGTCAPKAAVGATCAATPTSPAGSSCASGSCVGTHCCASACHTQDPECGATDCDSSGACVYPAPAMTCGPPAACNGATLMPQSSCNGQGSCTPVFRSCEPYGCDEQGAVCHSGCTAGGPECAADSFCAAQTCTYRGAPGKACGPTSTSGANQACLSGICSVHCCVVDCAVDPSTHNACKGTCDGSGACVGQTCPNNFGCSGTATCNTQCSKDADCDALAFCDPTGATGCCSRFSSGDTVYIDGSNGDDNNPCCGGATAPCQTVSHAMGLIAASPASGLTLEVQNTDGSTSWTANEVYPIHLGWGVTLHAPSISFVNRSYASDVFQVYAYAPKDTGTVSLQGGSGGVASTGMRIGFDSQLAIYSSSAVGVNDAVPQQTALPLILSGVWLSANDGAGDSYDLRVGDGAVVTLGPKPVEIGNGSLIGAEDPNLSSTHGIFCKGVGAMLRDDPKATSTVLFIESRSGDYLDIEDGCVATLTQGPTFGAYDTTPAGWDGVSADCPAGTYCQIACNTLAGNGGAVVAGSGFLTFGSAKLPGVIRCANYGFDQEVSNSSGSPTVAVNAATVDLLGYAFTDNTSAPPSVASFGFSCAGAMVTEGTFTATSTTFTHGYLGVYAGGNALRVDLSGGKTGGNTFTCNDALTWGQNQQYACGNNNYQNVPQSAGAGVVNTTGALGISARNGIWDLYDVSAKTTQVWSCSDTTYLDCTCIGPNCSSYTSPGTPPDGADAIYLSTNTAANPLDTSAGSQSSATSCQ